MGCNMFWSTHQHNHHQAKGVDSTYSMVWQPLTSHTNLVRQRVMWRTWLWREKSILSFRSATGLCAATARWARGLSKIHTRLAGSKASGPCVFQRKRWGKRFFVAALVHLTLCICLPLCLCSVPTLTQYPSAPICVIFSSQNGVQPTCLPKVENTTLYLLIWISRVQTIFCHYRYTLQIPRLSRAAWDWEVKRQEARRWEALKSLSSRTVVNWACASLMGGGGW